MIDYDFLKFLRGKDEITFIVEEPFKIQNIKEKIALINENIKNRPRIKTFIENRLNINDIFQDKNKLLFDKEKEKKINKLIKSLPLVKSTEPCPEGYIRSTRTGNCVKDKKYKLKKAQKVNMDNSILKILKEIKK